MSRRRTAKRRTKNNLSQIPAGNLSAILTAAVAVMALVGAFMTAPSHASSSVGSIHSGISGYCLDIHNDQLSSGSSVDAWACNNSDAQVWTVRPGRIIHSGNYCLSVNNDSQTVGSQIVTKACNQAAGQVWLKDASHFLNPNSGLCLSLPGSQTAQPLVLAGCSKAASDSWQASVNDESNDCASGSKGEKIACSAEKEFSLWQSGRLNHNQLLNQYTDGRPYEEWCADFVSYVYKEAGFAFKGGESSGWDESNANHIKDMGFTVHYPGSYVPRLGDIGYFSYSGGHVEIVVSGGKNPTFIYGNSATVDSSTGNGQMMSNTKTADGEFGQLVYYLSPN